MRFTSISPAIRLTRTKARLKRYGESRAGKGMPTAIRLRCPVSLKVTDRATGRYFLYDQETQDIRGDLALAYGCAGRGKTSACSPISRPETSTSRCAPWKTGRWRWPWSTWAKTRLREHRNRVVRGDTLAFSVPKGDVTGTSGTPGPHRQARHRRHPEDVVTAERERADRKAARDHRVRLEEGGGRPPAPPARKTSRAAAVRRPAGRPDASRAEAAGGKGKGGPDRADPDALEEAVRARHEIRVSFTAPKSFDEKSWIGIVPSGTPHGSEETNDAHDSSSKYLKKRTSGELVLKAPAKAGEYDIRMHDSDTRGNEVAYVTFRVVEPESPSSPAAARRQRAGKDAHQKDVPTRPEPTAPPVKETPKKDSVTRPEKFLRPRRDKTGIQHRSDGHVAKPRYTPGEPVKVTFTAPESYSANAWLGIVRRASLTAMRRSTTRTSLRLRCSASARPGRHPHGANAPGDYDVRLHNRAKGGKETAFTSFRVSKKK